MLENRTLDKSVPIPLYYQLKMILEEEITNKNYPVGSMIPTESELCDIFGVSRTTVRQAIMELVQEGKLYRIQSKGTLVSKPKVAPQVIMPQLHYDDMIRSTGRVPSIEVIEFSVIPMPDCLISIGAGDENSKAIYLYRKHLANGEPIMRAKSYFPYDRCSFILGMDFTMMTIHEALDMHEETRLYKISRTIEAVAAGHEDVEVLDMVPGSPVQLVTNVRYNVNGDVIDCSFAYYRGDQNKFQLDMIIG